MLPPKRQWNPAQQFTCLTKEQQAKLWAEAIATNDVAAVDWMVSETSFDVNTPMGATGTVGLSETIRHQHYDLFRTILKSDNIDLTVVEPYGQSPFIAAAQEHDPSYLVDILERATVIKKLGEANSKVLAVMFGVSETITPSRKFTFQPNIPNCQGYTGLMFAARQGLAQNVEFILNIPNIEIQGQTLATKTAPRRNAADLAAISGHWRVVERLRDVGLEPSQPMSPPTMQAFFDKFVPGK